MIFEWSSRFQRAYRKLSADQRERIKVALRRFAEDPRHPSLRVKKLRGVEGIWEARASDDLRFTFEPIEGGIRLRMVGHHDPTLRAP